MNIKPLTPADAASFQALRLRALQEAPEAFASSYEEELGTSVETVASRLAAPDSITLGAFDDSKLVGLCGVVREKHIKLRHKAFIWGVFVVPEARRRGVGSRIVRAALDYATQRLGVERVNLGVNIHNAAAVALYRRLGFQDFGVEHDFLRVGGISYDEYHMAWQASVRSDSSSSGREEP